MKKNIITKKNIIALLILVSVMMATSCTTTHDNMGYDSIYNSELGYVITLGMSKDKIDKLLGYGVKNYYYEYPDGLSVMYEDEKAVTFVLEGIFCPWEIKGGLSTLNNTNDVFTAFGEKEIQSIHLGHVILWHNVYYPVLSKFN